MYSAFFCSCCGKELGVIAMSGNGYAYDIWYDNNTSAIDLRDLDEVSYGKDNNKQSNERQEISKELG
jgi:hypothetical protein